MGVLADPKKEKFAHLIVRGVPVSDAYIQAGYKPNTGNASSMKKREEIQRRVQEIIEERNRRGEQDLQHYIEDSGITPGYIISRMVDIAKKAEDSGQLAVAKDAMKDVGRELFGMFHDKKEIKVEQNVSLGRAPSVSELANLFEKVGRAAESLIDADYTEVVDEGGDEFSEPGPNNDRLLGPPQTDSDGEEPH